MIIKKEGLELEFLQQMLGRPPKSKLSILLEDRVIEIKDKPDEPRYWLEASVLESGIVEFNLHTRNRFFPFFSFRHPDMYAARFVGAALKHFHDRGVDIMADKERWNEGSDNFNEFMRGYKMIGDPVESAKRTWSGRIMARNGFTETRAKDVLIINCRLGKRVEVFFSRHDVELPFYPGMDFEQGGGLLPRSAFITSTAA